MNEQFPFPSFNPELQKMIRTAYTRAYFNEGDPVLYSSQIKHTVALIAKGNIKIFREDEEGRDMFLYKINAGQVCVYSLLGDLFPQPCHIKGKAMEDTEVWFIPLNYVKRWMTKSNCWNEFVLNSFQLHMMKINSILDLVLFKKLDERLEYYLKSHAGNENEPCVQASHREIADEMNLSRETVSRVLKKMKLQGKVKLSRNQVAWID